MVNDLKSIKAKSYPISDFIPQDQTLGFVPGFFQTVKPILKVNSHSVICGRFLLNHELQVASYDIEITS